MTVNYRRLLPRVLHVLSHRGPSPNSCASRATSEILHSTADVPRQARLGDPSAGQTRGRRASAGGRAIGRGSERRGVPARGRGDPFISSSAALSSHMAGAGRPVSCRRGAQFPRPPPREGASPFVIWTGRWPCPPGATACRVVTPVMAVRVALIMWLLLLLLLMLLRAPSPPRAAEATMWSRCRSSAARNRSDS